MDLLRSVALVCEKVLALAEPLRGPWFGLNLDFGNFRVSRDEMYDRYKGVTELIAVWFDERRFATLVGLAMLLGNFGSMLAGSPLTALAQVTSWRGVFVAAG